MALINVTTGKIAEHILKYTKTFPQLTAPGNTDHINIPGARFHTFQTTVANKNTNVVVRVEGSINGSNFFTLPVEGFTATGITYTNQVATITADGTYLIYVRDIAIQHVRFVFVSESGGTDATIDVEYFGRS